MNSGPGFDIDRKAGRDIRLDALRGLMLAVMTMDHFPSLFFNYTYQSLGYVTTAEGFVFLSGLVAGRVYARSADNENLLWKRAAKRAVLIYSVHLLTFLTLFAMAALSVNTWGLQNWATEFYQRPLSALLMGFSLIYQPKFLDILPLYAVLIVTVPIAVQLAKRKRLSLLVIGSVVVWLLAQFGLRERLMQALSTFGAADLGTFDLFSWQLIFILGICIGIRGMTDLIPVRFRKPVIILCGITAAVLFCIHRGIIFSGYRYEMESFSIVGTLGPVRLLNFLVVALLFRQVLSWMDENFVVRGLALLGRHSLAVFTFQIFLLYLFFGIFRESHLKELWVVAFVGSLFLPAWILERHRQAGKVVRIQSTETNDKTVLGV